MKKIVLFVMVFSIALTTYSQKKKNGTIYSEHPAIDIAEAFNQAVVSGDVDKVSSYLSEDFKRWNGSSTNPNAKGTDKEQYLKNIKFWNENLSYFSIERMKEAYPDAIEYKDPDEEGVWVQTWDIMKGVHTKTGSKINTPLHSLYKFDAKNKIVMIIDYQNDEVFGDQRRSFDVRENGVIYDQHEYINTVKMGFAAFENGDFETAYSFFDADAKFRSSSLLPGEKAATLEEFKASNEVFLNNFEVIAIDMNGYPDLLHYDRADTYNVQSWWTFRLIRKADDKKVQLPAFYTHTFNEEGKIINVSSYINMKLLDE